MFQLMPLDFQHAPLSGVAAPIGRTLLGGRGCALGSIIAWLAVPVCASTVVDDIPVLPSQADIEVLEFLQDATDPDAVVFRARYVMPAIARSGGGLDYDDVAEDFVTLCEAHALPVIRADGFSPARIVVSLSDRVTEFGVADTEATQLFEAFIIEGDTCIWEQF